MFDHAQTCSIDHAAGVSLPEDVQESSDALACLLTDLPEFQNYLRLDRAVRLDETVSSLRAQLSDARLSLQEQEALEKRLEALPLLQEYRRSQQAVRDAFAAVETVISQAAGLSFAENARPAGFS